MKKRYRRVYLLNMLERVIDVESFVAGVTFEQFAGDQMRRDATERELEMIGIVAEKLGDEFMGQNPDIPWSAIIGMRDIYGDGRENRPQVSWEAATASLPLLKTRLLEELGPDAVNEL